MRLRVRVLLVSVWLLPVWGFTAGDSAAWAQTASPPAVVQTPAGKPPGQPAKTAGSAPHTSDHKAGSTPPPSKTPIVPSRGPIHPHKPVAKAGSASVKPPPPNPPAGVTEEAKPAEKLPDPEKPEGPPARLPRFASLRSDDVNMRAGPGTRYRIDWVYRRRELPVEIEREFDVWRWVRDPDGIQGWVHQATLMGRRSFIVQKADTTLRAEPSDSATAVAILKLGVIGRIRSCQASSDWCDVQAGSYRGYLRRTAFWGLLPGEAINP